MYSNKAYNGIVVNRTLSSLHGRSFEITLTVPLQPFFRGSIHRFDRFSHLVTFTIPLQQFFRGSIHRFDRFSHLVTVPYNLP